MPVSQTAGAELPTAFYAVMVPGGTLESGLAALGLTGIFDQSGVPEDQPYDYVTLGDITEVPWNALQHRGYEATMTLHIWTRQGGFQQAFLIANRLNQLFDQQTLTLPTQQSIATMYDGLQTMNDEDARGRLQHVPIRYRAFTQE